MRTTGFLLTVFALASACEPPRARAQKLPPAERTPILVLDYRGSPAPVTALAFAPDASVLYVGGLDKLVRRYALKGGQYVPIEPLRVPVGTGLAGAINAVAVSPDGRWVAVAGRAPVRGEVWAGSDDGISLNTQFLSKTMKQDFGVVYLFDTTNPGGGRVIRGAESAVQVVAFANPVPAGGHKLLTAGIEWDAANKKQEGVVRVFDVTTGNEEDMRRGLPATMTRPGLAAWAVGAGKKDLRVAVASRKENLKDDGELLVWDAPGGVLQRFPEGAVNFPLAVRLGKNGGAAELLTTSFDTRKAVGRLTARDADPVGKPRITEFPGTPGRAGPLPLAIAPLAVLGFGEATAVVLRDTSAPAGATIPHELRLLGPGGKSAAGVPLNGMSVSAASLLAASADGRFLAVAGFADNRVEVYDAAKLAANQDPKLTTVESAKGGYAKVTFLAGNKLWMGGPADTAAKGGLVLDLATRKAVANDGKTASDSPPTPTVTLAPGKVSGNGFKEITLRRGFNPTAVALLPVKPAWNPQLGALVAVAMTHEENRQTLVTLFDAATGKRVIDLEGPALRIEALAFSSSRALLAAVGADHAVSVWSLRNLKADLPAIAGVAVAARDGTVVVESVEPGGPASEKLAVGNVIEQVGPEKGKLTEVKTPFGFLLAVRALQVGDRAQLKLKGQAAPVLVPVGVSVGHRHPLVTLWVDPDERRGVHDWVGWTPAGPYDTNSPEGEARIGWVTATGDETRPATFEGAKQHRDDFHKLDLIRYVLDEADFDAGVKRWLADRPPPELGLSVNLDNLVDRRDGRVITRLKSTQLNVMLDDPHRLIDLEQAVLRWRTLGAEADGEWQDVSFRSGRGEIDLRGYRWTRGQHRFEFELFRNRTAAVPELRQVAVFEYVPPAPVVIISIDGKKVEPGSEVATQGTAVVVGVSVRPGPDGPATFTVIAGAGKPVTFLDDGFGFFSGRKVTLKPSAKTEILVTARTIGEGVYAEDESHTVGVAVRQLPSDAPPRVSLRLTTPYNPRTDPAKPFLVDNPKIALAATVESQDPITAFEWDLGDGQWVPGKLDPKTATVLLPTDGTSRTIRARATSGKRLAGEDAVAVVYTALPADAIFAAPPEKVTASGLELAARIENPGTVPFTLRVAVGSGRTGQTREFDAVQDVTTKAWKAAVTLWPGENRIGVVIRNRFREVHRAGLIAVNYVRPPALVSVPPVNAGTDAVAPVVVTGITPAGAGPTELRINDKPVSFKQVGNTVRVLGLDLWALRADGFPVTTAAGPLEKVSVVVRNAEGESTAREAKVIAMKLPPPRPPKIVLSRGETPIGGDQTSNRDAFTFTLRVSAEKPLTRVELWHDAGMAGRMELVTGVGHEKAKAAADGFELDVTPVLKLRSGVNSVRVVAATGQAAAESEFRVTYLPPAVRVMIDKIEEPTPGKNIALKWPADGPVQADGYLLQIKGRVVWDNDDDPVARNPNLRVVFVANHVAHPGLEPKMPVGGNREREFAGPVYVHAKQSTVRVELRSGPRPGAMPQQGSDEFEFAVNCAKPLDRQRLHVLVIGVDVPERGRVELAKKVVAALDGKIPGNNPSFDSGVLAFDHPEFTRAMVYPPRVGYAVNKSTIDGLLMDVEKMIAQTRKQPGQDWVNDVVLLYYQGRDMFDKDDRRRLHTSLTLLAGPAVAERETVAVEYLYPTPGWRLPVLNVDDPGKPQLPRGPFAEALPLLRYGWKDAGARELLLPILQATVARRRTVGDVVDGVRSEVTKLEGHMGQPIDTLPDDVRPRIIGPRKP